LFVGLQGGAFLWQAIDGDCVARTFYKRPRWPGGRILAIDRAYVQLDADTAVAWEYGVGRGRVVCLGSHVGFADGPGWMAPQRDRYVLNALAHLEGETHVDPGPRDRPRDSSRSATSVYDHSTQGNGRSDPMAPIGTLPDMPLQLAGEAGPDASVTLAGRRVLLVGTEGGGVDEIWIHPVCVASEGVRLAVGGQPLVCEHVVVSPGLVVRHLRDWAGGAWREVLTVSPDRGLALIEIAPGEGSTSREVEVALTLRMRLEWPVPGDALHPLESALRHDEGRATLSLAGVHGDTLAFVEAVGVGRAGIRSSTIAPGCLLHSQPGEPLRLAIGATTEGPVAEAMLRRRVSGDLLSATVREHAAATRRRLDGSTAVAFPEPVLNDAWPWALERLSSFIIETPALGPGLSAGYAASRPGWGDARPGYAWFFGRDACWSADALLAAGRFDDARVALEFLARTMDVTGQVAHEVTTSGVAHYDAADSTPLFLRLVGRYVAWTGDLATVRALWPRVRAAFDVCCRHDRDGDALPENSGVGHGWIESGPLGGGAVTSYVAAIWIDALAALVGLSDHVGDAELAARARDWWSRARASFDHRLRDPDSGLVALQLGADGQRQMDRTALSAVPILLGVDSAASARDVLQVLASADFSAPWGVRLISRRDARYRARGYHFGAVWPLYTGWAAWASFALGEGDLGLKHLTAVASCAAARERGAFDEVLDGETGAAAGVCPDQAWSAAMVVSPVICGMLGMVPDAPLGRCLLDPRWPSGWPSAGVRGLRVGSARFSIAMLRPPGMGACRYTLRHEGGGSVEVQVGRGAGAAHVHLAPGAREVVTVPDAGEGGHGRR